MWSLACITDPRFSEERIEITKPVSLVYIMDDIFDAYGSLDELTLFHDAVTRYGDDLNVQICIKSPKNIKEKRKKM